MKLTWTLALCALASVQSLSIDAMAQARRPATPRRPVAPVVSITPTTETPASAQSGAAQGVTAGAATSPPVTPATLLVEAPMDITAPVPVSTPSAGGTSPTTPQNANRSANSQPIVDAPDEDEPATVPCPTVETPAVEMMPVASVVEYVRRSNVLMGTAGFGVASPQGTSSDNIAGISTAVTFRMVFNHFLLDPSLGLSWVPTNNSAPLQIQPGLRMGYVGQIGERTALGVRAGYGMIAQPVGSNAGILHALDLDMHVTFVSRRGMLIEPYLTLGATIANPTWPIALIGARMGYWL